MKKIIVAIVVAAAIILVAVEALGGSLGRMLSELFGADYTGTAEDVYHGNYIKFTTHASGYQMLGQQYSKGDLWYPSSSVYDGGHIITNDQEFSKMQSQIDQDIAPVDFDKYILFVDTERTQLSTKIADRTLRFEKVGSLSATDTDLIVNRVPTNDIIKPIDGKSHIGYYNILKIKKEDFPYEQHNFQVYERKTNLDEAKDEIVYAE